MHNIRFEVEHCTAEFTCARREADAGRTERKKVETTNLFIYSNLDIFFVATGLFNCLEKTTSMQFGINVFSKWYQMVIPLKHNYQYYQHLFDTAHVDRRILSIF